MANNRIQFVVDNQTLDRLTPTGEIQSPSLSAKRAVERYYSLINWSLREVQYHFSYAEIALIADVLNGIGFHSWEMQPSRSLRMNLIDAIEMDRLDEKWQVDATVFRGKLNALTDAQAAAVIEAIDLWWLNPERSLSITGFEEVGLIAEEVNRDPVPASIRNAI